VRRCNSRREAHPRANLNGDAGIFERVHQISANIFDIWVLNFQVKQAIPEVRHPRGRMRSGLPLDDGRISAGVRQGTILRHRYAPRQRITAYLYCRTRRRWRASQRRIEIVGSHNPRRQVRHGMAETVQIEPSRTRRCRRRGIDRDDLEEQSFAQPQQMIMGAHFPVLAAGWHGHAKRILDMGQPFVERPRDDGEVVKGE